IPIQTFALSGGKAPAAKPMHTGTLGKTSRGGINRSYSEIPRPAAAGGWFPCRTGCFSSEYGLRQPKPNGWPRRGEKSVYQRLMKADVSRQVWHSQVRH